MDSGLGAVTFGDYTFDARTCELTRFAQCAKLEPQVARLLAALIARAPELATRSELHRALWPTGGGSDNALNHCVRAARAALKHAPNELIVAVRSQGYRFTAEVSRKSALSACVGRASELAELDRLARTSLKRRCTSFALVTGPAGIGKSHLVRHFAAQWRARGTRVLWGNCSESLGQGASFPWATILSAIDSSEARAVIGERGTAQFVGAASTADRYAWFVRVRNVIEEEARRTPLMIVLEDIHLADDATVNLVRFLFAGEGAAPVLCLATARVPMNEAQVATTAELGRFARSVRLDPLAPKPAEQVLREITGVSLTPEWERHLLERAGGNPLFLSELGTWAAVNSSKAQHLVLSEISGIADAIRWHLSIVGDAALRVLKLASVAGEHFNAKLLAVALACDVELVLESLATALKFGAVRRLSPLDYQFQHDLHRQYLYDTLPDLERRAHHWAVGAALVRLNWHVTAEGKSSVAHHLTEGAVSDEQLMLAAESSRAAADSARNGFAFAAAAAHYERTFRLAETCSWQLDEKVALLVAATDCLRISGRWADAMATSARAIEMARMSPSGVAFARAAIAQSAIGVEYIGHQKAHGQWLEQALVAVSDECRELRSQICARLSEVLYLLPGVEERRLRLASEALRLAENTDVKTWALACAAKVYAHWGLLEDKIAWPDWIDDAIRAARTANEPELELRARIFKLASWLERGEVDRALADAELLKQDGMRLENALARYSHSAILGGIAIVREPSRAVLLCEAALGEGRGAIGEEAAVHIYGGQLLMMAWESGRATEAADNFRVAAETGHGTYKAGYALSIAMLGRTEETSRAFQAAMEGPLPADNSSLAGLGILGEVSAYLDNRNTAFCLYERLLPFRSYLMVTGAGYIIAGIVPYALARLAAVLGDKHRALAHVDEAQQLAERLRSPNWLRRCEVARRRIATGRIEGWLPRSLD